MQTPKPLLPVIRILQTKVRPLIRVCDRIPNCDTHALDKSGSKVYGDATEASDQLLKISGYRTMSDPLETFSAVGGWNLANKRCSFWFSSGTRSGAIFGN